MKSTVENLSPTRIRLTAEVPFEELKPSLDAAYRRFSRQVTIPGFRRGGIPDCVIDERFDRTVLLQDAVDEALPQLYTQAADQAGALVLGRPEITGSLTGRGDLRFTAEVDVCPEVALPPFGDIHVTVEPVEVTDEEVAEAVRHLCERFASLTRVERPAAAGDVVVVDLQARVDGEVPEDGTATAVSYEIGSGGLLDGLDSALIGLEAGGSTAFTSRLKGGTHAGREAEVTVRVTAVQEKELPAPDEGLLRLAGGFATLEELWEDTRRTLVARKVSDRAAQAVLDALLAEVEVPLPASEVQALPNGVGQAEEEARKALKTRLLLDRIAARAELSVSRQELDEHLTRRAAGFGLSAQQFVRRVTEAGRMPALVGEILRGKALALVVEAARVVDADGNPVVFEDGEDRPAAGEPEAAHEVRLRWPPGHYYSPVPGSADTRRALEWRERGMALDELPGIELRAEAQRALLRELAGFLGELPSEPVPGQRYTPHNPMFGLADASVYHAMLRYLRPRRVVEVGSGYSSALALDTAGRYLPEVSFTFVEPYAERLRKVVGEELLSRCTVLEQPAQDTDPRIFAALESGDVLFIDSTHVAKAGSDVVWLLGEVLPRLHSGVRVHLHDVFWPFEYPPHWLNEGRAWNELYAVRAFLAHNDAFEIELFASWLWLRERELVRSVQPEAADALPGSLWLRRR